ncbi:DUF5753 domain-containing protein [Nonomuraea sp. bgisy101]
MAGREAANAARLRSAHRIQVFQSVMIPSLLQTADYARTALALAAETGQDDVAEAAAVRMEAQSLLFEFGRQFSFVLTEGAVRTWLGSAALMRAQLERLARASTLSNVSLGIVPGTVTAPGLPPHGFTVLDGVVSVVETLTGDLTPAEPAATGEHADAFDVFAAVAVYGDTLRELLRQISADYEELETRFGD